MHQYGVSKIQSYSGPKTLINKNIESVFPKSYLCQQTKYNLKHLFLEFTNPGKNTASFIKTKD